MEIEITKERLLKDIEKADTMIQLARCDEVLTEYQVIDLKLRIVDLKIKLLEQWHTNNLKQNFTKTLQN